MENNFDKEIFNLLKELKFFRKRELEGFILRFLEEAKRFRDKNGKKEAEKMGWNIYNKRNINVRDIINKAEEKGLIELERLEEDSIKITKTGIKYLNNIYTNNFSDEYIKFRNLMNEEYEKTGIPCIDEEIIMSMFYHNCDIKERLEYDKNHHPFSEYMHHLLESNNIKYSEDDYIFNLKPQLFVPIPFISSKVSFEIVCNKSINVPNNMIITKPYPNKRYFIIGQKFKNEKTSAGIFPIVCKKEIFPDDLYLELHWTIDDKYKIIHKINFQFDKTQKFGNVFSTNQQFALMSNLKEFNMISSMETDILDDMKNGKRDVKVINKRTNIEIIENLTLSNFPIEYQGGLYADKYASKFINDNR